MGKGKGHSNPSRESLRFSSQKGKKAKKLKLPQKGEGFSFDKQGVLTLITPKSKTRWKDEERVFRSMIINREGEVVSLGLPKFFDLEDNSGALSRLREALSAGEPVYWSEKYDGSLIIRSVIRGKVVFRTRNHFNAEQFQAEVETLAREKYPELLNPEFYPQGSLHFEYVSPRHRIVVNYHEPDLILIGAIDHQELKVYELPRLAELGNQAQLRLVNTHEFKTLEEAQSTVNSWEDREGVVIRFQGELWKLKSSAYRLAHKKRFQYNPQLIYQTLERKNYQTAGELIKAMDEEKLNPYLKECFEGYQKLQSQLEGQLKELQELYNSNQHLSRKEFAKLAHSLPVPLNLALLALREKKLDKARELLRTHGARDFAESMS